MQARFGSLLASVFALLLALAVPSLSRASVILNGCAGGTFGNDCGLNELLAGGSFSINGTQFSGWTLDTFADPFNPSLIRVTPLDSLANPGFALIDTGNTLRAANGANIGNTVSFNATTPFRFAASTLAVGFGQITNPGEFTFADVSETVFNSAFSLIGDEDVLCQTAACANSTRSTNASFARQSSLLAFLNITASSGSVGDVGQINTITATFNQVAEPSTLALIALAVAMTGFARQRRARNVESCCWQV